MSLFLAILLLRFGVSPDAQIKNILSAPNNGCDSQSRRENFVDARAFYGGNMEAAHRKTHQDLTGKRFFRLVIKKLHERTLENRLIWECVCDCGKTTMVRVNNLLSGNTVSCGCYGDERRMAARTTHGLMRKHYVEYHCWLSMRGRCLNKRNGAYHNYGGRGIMVCRRWLNSFPNFLKDMGKRPTPKHSIDRENNNRGYYPSNCRWATRKEQNMNTRQNHYISINSKRHIISEWDSIMGFGRGTIYRRLISGWSEYDAVTIPQKVRIKK